MAGPPEACQCQCSDNIGLITRVSALPDYATREAGVWLVSDHLKWLQSDVDQAWACL